jgi:hypothetical protein
MRIIAVSIFILAFASLAAGQNISAITAPPFHCDILDSPMVGTDAGVPPAPAAPAGTKGEQVRSLAVRITTSNDLFSDTHDDVWLDIGPKAWKIGDVFEKGSTRTINIDLSKPYGDQDLPTLVPLFVDDIIHVRIEKKGICGLTDSPDSLFDPQLLTGFNPLDPVGSLRKQVQVAAYLVDQKKSLAEQQQKIIDQQVQNIAAAQKIIDDAANTAARAPQLVAQMQNQVVDLQRSIAQTPTIVVKEVCKTNDVVTGILFGVGAVISKKIVCHNENVVNDAWTRLNNNLSDVQKAKNNLEADLASAGIRSAAALQSRATALAAKGVAEATKAQAELEYALATRALTEVQHRLQDLDEFVKKTPLGELAKLGIPIPGEWQLESVTLIVNGKEFRSFNVNERLKRGHGTWVGGISPLPAQERVARALRVNLNKVTPNDEFGRVATLAKNLGISGWQDAPAREARVVGVLRHDPSAGSDDYVSLDLEVERIEIRGKTYLFDDAHGIRHKRYIRIEYKRRNGKGEEDVRYKGWKQGDRFVATGPLRWDTDRNGYFEIHPDHPGALKILANGKSGASSAFSLWWNRTF